MNWLTMLGNLHAAQSLLIALVQLLVGGFFGGAQPGFGFMRALDPWKFLTEVLGVLELINCREDATTRNGMCPLEDLGPRLLGLGVILPVFVGWLLPIVGMNGLRGIVEISPKLVT